MRAGSHMSAHIVVHPVRECDVTESVVQIGILMRCAHLESGSERVASGKQGAWAGEVKRAW
jgi:hypothetical protein